MTDKHNETVVLKVDSNATLGGISKSSSTSSKTAAARAAAREATPIQLWSNNFLSNWVFAWVFPLVARAYDRSVNFAKVTMVLRPSETARINTDLLQKAWAAEYAAKKQSASFVAALRAVFGTEYAAIAGYKISHPVPRPPARLALFLSCFFSSIAIHQQYGECNRVGVKVKAAITGLVYRKSLRVSRLKGGAGEVINILSTDVTRINDAVVNLHFLWAAFVEIYLGKRINELNREQTARTTERVHLMSEILTAIKLIKFYAWEAPFTQKIDDIRRKEMALIVRVS
ncbi:hypothetical protein BC831DRAFT_516405 [Entophlyctis helioformis]|nr:hypothetical protein BC831DRAFT_516405 [Entophlyctis helioformis]